MNFLDTNIFIRFLANDDHEKGMECRQLLKSLEHDQEAGTSEAVIAEIVFVMTSKALYALSRDDICQRLRPILNLRGLRIPDKRRVMRAIDLFESTPQLSFVDCLISAHVSDSLEFDAVISYDRGFDRVPGLKRLEPSAI